MRFELDCPDCAFASIADSDDEALELADAHRISHLSEPYRHIVTIRQAGRPVK